ncbi:hypothetical protein [Porphyrobacter sp. AAP82]|uniref:hypothetical protein n=1 Tax=Porphyrobacter sp. AAP82 TaxID=1248917 RepID=UPI0003140781|nr:hypothetical protein [Porphyrobacter sp. AAP82]
MTPPDRDAQRTAQRGREVQAIIARVEGEHAALEAQLAERSAPEDRARIETEILHLALALGELRGGHYSGG